MIWSSPEARPNPGYDGIYGMLEACSSQTSNFNWGNYIRSVEDRLGQHAIVNERRRWFLCLRPETLLAAMDYLYIIQKFPEDRKMIIDNHQGILTIIVWAYHLLNLTVLAKGTPAGDVTFGKETISPQIIILWNNNRELFGHEISLLDRNSQVVLQTEPDEMTFSYLEACERLPLLNYGTTILHRHLNRNVSALRNDPVYTDAAQMAVAMALVGSRNLVRKSAVHRAPPMELPMVIERWRMVTFANIIFEDLSLDIKAIDGFVDALLEDEEADNEVPLPRSLELHLKRVKKSTRWTQDAQNFSLGLLRRLAKLIIVFGNVSGVENSATLPLNSDISQLDLSLSSVAFRKNVAITESHFLDHIFGILSGNHGLHQGNAQNHLDERTFLISDFGWSFFVSTLGDTDPGSVQSELLFLRKGVPTKVRTGERRPVIKDAPRDLFFNKGLSLVPERKTLDKGRSYAPRSVYRRHQLTEYYGVLKDEFQLNIRFSGEEEGPVRQMTSDMRARFEGKGTGRAFFEESLSEPEPSSLYLSTEDDNKKPFAYDTSYRHLHRSLWDMRYTSPCSHTMERDLEPTMPPREARLGMGAATATIFGWEDEGETQFGEVIEVPERICILLAKGDRRARWLAVANAAACPARNTMLCTRDCCEDCALDMVNQLSGKWLLII